MMEKELNNNSVADTRLLELVRKGDHAAFEQLYYRWHKPVMGFMFKATRSEHDAEDIAQEVFVKLWNMRDKIDPAGNVQALIFVIARRAAIDLYRRTGRMGPLLEETSEEEDFSPGRSPQEILEARETELLLQITIAGMPDRRREIFSLHYYENLPSAEIARKLGLSYENVRKQIYTGKQQLRGVVSALATFLLVHL